MKMDRNLADRIFEKDIKDKYVAARILEHTRLVDRISQDIARKIIKAKVYKKDIDLGVLALCAILHDIGRERNPPGTPHSLRHNISGQKIIENEIILLEKELLKQRIMKDAALKNNVRNNISALKIRAKVCRTHTCVGFSPAEVKRYHLDLPPGDYTPRSIYERIVCYADKLADGKRRCDIGYSVERFGKWLGKDYRNKVIRFDKRMRRLMGELK